MNISLSAAHIIGLLIGANPKPSANISHCPKAMMVEVITPAIIAPTHPPDLLPNTPAAPQLKKITIIEGRNT